MEDLCVISRYKQSNNSGMTEPDMAIKSEKR